MHLSYTFVLFLTSCHASITNQKVLSEGNCSPETMDNKFDSVIESGDHCLPGQHFLDGNCEPLPTPASLEPPASPPLSAQATCTSCPGDDLNTCPPYRTLGIRYGRCYTLTDLERHPIARTTNAAGLGWYYFSTTINLKQLVFRICHNLTEASCHSLLDEYVLDNGYWYMLDQRGVNGDYNPDFVGSKAYGAYSYLAITSTVTSIVNFQAKIRCIFGICSPCVRLYSKTGTTANTTFGLTNEYNSVFAGDAIKLVAPGNYTCFPLIFQETACLDV